MANAAKIEQALFLSRLPEVDTDLSGYQRLYFGAEFCPWNIPACSACLRALEWAHSNSLAFTLATPVLIEPWLPRLTELLQTLSKQLTADDEILISDWGALEIIREVVPEVPVIVGRTLSGQKRGPRILDLDLTREQRDYFQRGSWHSAESAALLRAQGITRVELDNLLQGVAALPDGLTGSLHSPWIMVASSRNCPFREDSGSDGCAAPCGESFTLATPETRVPLIQAGNTQFLESHRLPDNLTKLGISRLVEHRAIPR
jgi:hypothetical protein